MPSVPPAAEAAAERSLTFAGIVDGDRDVGMADEAHETPDFGTADDLVGDEDVPDAGLDKHLGLPYLGAGNALGPCRELLVGDGRALVRLEMRAQARGLAFEERLHAGDIGLEGVEVDYESRRVDFGEVGV